MVAIGAAGSSGTQACVCVNIDILAFLSFMHPQKAHLRASRARAKAFQEKAVRACMHKVVTGIAYRPCMST